MSEIKGFDELDRVLRNVTPKVERALTRKGVRAAAKPVIKAAKQNIRSMLQSEKDKSGTGNLYKSVGVRVWTVPSKGIIGGVVGPRWPQGAHGHLVEFGHQITPNKRHAKSGKRQAIGMDGQRRTKPHPFLAKARVEMQRAVREAWAAKIDEELKKIGK